MRQFWMWFLWSTHVLLWLALAITAYLTAGPYKFASCWHIIPIYILPLGWIQILLAGYGLIVVPAAIFRPTFRQSRYFAVSCHVTIFTLGWMACAVTAFKAVDSASCL